MKLEQQVTSLELSKKLKELGVKQDSLFHWIKRDKVGGFYYQLIYSEMIDGKKYKDAISAFTVAELGEMLPYSIEQGKPDWNAKHLLFLDQYFDDHMGEYGIAYNGHVSVESADSIFNHKEKASTEVNARAKMLIYLLENKLYEKAD